MLVVSFRFLVEWPRQQVSSCPPQSSSKSTTHRSVEISIKSDFLNFSAAFIFSPPQQTCSPVHGWKKGLIRRTVIEIEILLHHQEQHKQMNESMNDLPHLPLFLLLNSERPAERFVVEYLYSSRPSTRFINQVLSTRIEVQSTTSTCKFTERTTYQETRRNCDKAH